jgi:hypothetical protein
MISSRLTAWALGYGLVVWFETTLIIRWFVDLIFIPDSLVWTVGGFAITAGLVFVVGWVFFAWMKTPPVQRMASAIIICSIGLVADAFVFAYIDQVFPSMTLEQQRLFAGWVVWAYGIGLVSGIWPRHLYWVPVD